MIVLTGGQAGARILPMGLRSYRLQPPGHRFNGAPYIHRADSQPSALQASFGWFRALGPVSAFNQSYTTKKLTVPVLALGGDKMMGGVYGSDDASIAENVRGGAISVSGHWVIEEQPETLLRELLSFLP